MNRRDVNSRDMNYRYVNNRDYDKDVNRDYDKDDNKGVANNMSEYFYNDESSII